jgi:SAM-dependent methyltransferase
VSASESTEPAASTDPTTVATSETWMARSSFPSWRFTAPKAAVRILSGCDEPVRPPERIVPDETEPGIVAIHLKRYEFARPFCVGKRVLDAACGVGYGTAYLAEHASEAIGLDRSEETIAYAQRRYARPNVNFEVGDVLELPHADASFDAVCSFETIEHLPDPARFVAEAARVLRADGVFVCSTPNADQTESEPENPFHEFDLSADDFDRLLRTEFAHVELYGQARLQTRRHRVVQRLDVLGLRRRVGLARALSRPLLGTPPMASLTGDDLVITRDSIDQARELVAVCRP